MEFIHPGFPSPSVTCRRLHDTNKSGMSLPLSLIILIRGIFSSFITVKTASMAQINPGHRKNIRSSRNDSKSSFTGKSAAYTVEKPCSPAHVLRFEGKYFIFRPCLLTTSAYSPGQEREETGWSASEGPDSCPREARTAVMEAMAEASFWKWIRTRMTCVLFFMIQN